MRVVVLDSCLFMKQFLNEADSETALVFLDSLLSKKSSILVPDLFFYEVFSIAMRENLQDLNQVFSLLQDYENNGLIFVKPTAEAIKTAHKIMKIGNKKSGFPSFYDSIYQAIAILHNCDFITSDKKHYEKTKKLGHIKLLREAI